MSLVVIGLQWRGHRQCCYKTDSDSAAVHAHRRARCVTESEAGRDMSDGDNATPGRPAGRSRHRTAPTNGLPELRGHRQAPRRGSADAGAEPGWRPTPPPPTGNHTDGVTVADLIAKVTGSRSGGSAGPAPRRTRARTSEPPAPPTEVIARQRRPRSRDPRIVRPGHRGHPRRVGPRLRSSPTWRRCSAAGAERIAPERRRASHPPSRPPTPTATARPRRRSCSPDAPWPRSSRCWRWR